MIKIPPKGEWLKVEERYKFKILPNGSRVLISEKALAIGVEGPDYGYILNTIFVAVIVTIFTSILGLVAAFIMARYDFPGKMLFRVVLLIPMLATPFVNAYVLGRVLGPYGLLNYILYDILRLIPYRIIISGLPAVILIQTLSYFPIVYLNTLSAIINIDPSLEEQAENLGAKLRIPVVARELNEEMFKRVISLIREALKTCGKPLRRAKISLLGISQTPNTKDSIKPLTKKLVRTLERKGVKVRVYDPYFSSHELTEMGYPTKKNLTENTEGADCIVIMTSHERFKRLNLKRLKVIMKKPAAIIDLVGVVEPNKAEVEGFTYRGLGRGVKKR